MSSLPLSLKSPLLRICASLVVTAGAFASLPAHAGAWTELGDAGQTPVQAQVTGNANPLDHIFGTLRGSTDADVYFINIVDPANFSATTSGPLDTQLFLFTLDGSPVYMNDDADGVTLTSALPGGHALGPVAPGIYLLAVSMAGYDPINENGQLLFANGATTDVRGPAFGLQPSALGGFADNTFFDDRGGYDITLTGANGAPEPSSVMLAALALGIGGWGARSRRRSQASA